MAATDGQIKYLAEELLMIQLGSVEDAIISAQDYPDEEDRNRLIEKIKELGDEMINHGWQYRDSM
jgi:hypothetical protein